MISVYLGRRFRLQSAQQNMLTLHSFQLKSWKPHSSSRCLGKCMIFTGIPTYQLVGGFNFFNFPPCSGEMIHVHICSNWIDTTNLKTVANLPETFMVPSNPPSQPNLPRGSGEFGSFRLVFLAWKDGRPRGWACDLKIMYDPVTVSSLCLFWEMCRK